MAEIFLSRIQHGLYPIGMVGRVGILLTLETYADVLGIGDAAFTGDVLVGTYALEISTIYLYTRLVGEHFHEDTGLRRIEAGAYLCIVALVVLEGVQAEVVVVASGVLNLIELRLDAVAESMRGTEIHGSALHRLDLTRGDVEFVAGGEVIGINI